MKEDKKTNCWPNFRNMCFIEDWSVKIFVTSCIQNKHPKYLMLISASVIQQELVNTGLGKVEIPITERRELKSILDMGINLENLRLSACSSVQGSLRSGWNQGQSSRRVAISSFHARERAFKHSHCLSVQTVVQGILPMHWPQTACSRDLIQISSTSLYPCWIRFYTDKVDQVSVIIYSFTK